MSAVTPENNIVYPIITQKFPAYVQVQRIPGVIGENHVSFHAHRFTPNFLLKAKAYIKWQLQIARVREDPVNGLEDEDYNQFDVIATKPWDVIGNATKSITCRYNSTGITYTEGRYWNKYIGLRHPGRANIEGYFSSQGAPFPDYNGIYNTQAQSVNAFNPASEEFQVGSTDSRLKDAIDQASDGQRQAILEEIPEATFEYIQHLNCGLFNPFVDVKDSIYKNSVYRKMTDLIPYVKEIYIRVDLKDYAVNTLNFMYAATPEEDLDFVPVELIDESILSASLYLVWVRPTERISFLLEPTMRFQSWYFDHREFSISDEAIANGTTISVNIQNQTIHQITSAITIFTMTTTWAKKGQKPILFTTPTKRGSNRGPMIHCPKA